MAETLAHLYIIYILYYNKCAHIIYIYIYITQLMQVDDGQRKHSFGARGRRRAPAQGAGAGAEAPGAVPAQADGGQRKHVALAVIRHYCGLLRLVTAYCGTSAASGARSRDGGQGMVLTAVIDRRYCGLLRLIAAYCGTTPRQGKVKGWRPTQAQRHTQAGAGAGGVCLHRLMAANAGTAAHVRLHRYVLYIYIYSIYMYYIYI